MLWPLLCTTTKEPLQDWNDLIVKSHSLSTFKLVRCDLRMQDGAERFEIVSKVMEQKEIIKKASQEIIEKIDDPLADRYINFGIIEILNAASNINIIANKSDRLFKFICAWQNMIDTILTSEPNELRTLLIKRALNMICTISFDVKKKGTRYEINMPKFDLSLLKIGT